MQVTRTLIQPVPYLAQVAAVAVVYFIAARMSLALAIPPGYATAVWPPSGIALAAALLLGARIWPAIWLGAALANVAVESSFFSAVVIGGGNTIEALAACALIRRYAGNPARFERGEDVVKFIAICALAGAIAATVALLPLAVGHSLSLERALRNWWTWWQGDLSGMLVAAPLILGWSARGAVPWPARKKLEAACFGLLLLVAAALITADNATRLAPFSLTVVALPFLVWAAFRFGQREVSTAIAVVCAIAVWYTLERHDLFTSAPLNEWLLMLLTFNSMVVLTGLALVAAVGERRRALNELRERHDRLESRSVFYRQAMPERVADDLHLENQLRRAIEREEFVLHYQPKVDVDSRRLTGLEALIRWQSPELGLVAPMRFIPLLEETGLILEVGAWALRRAVLDQALWAAQGLRVPRVAVNVSSIQLRQGDFIERVREALGPAAEAPLIDLEITETCIMEDIEANIGKLRTLRALGIGIAIDDFGTGYSSLAYLAKLPAQVLKIDQSFVARMLDDDDAMALVQTILSIAASLKLTTVAEGVESEGQADVLELLRCAEMQGYFISPPQSREKIASFLGRD